MEGIIKFKANKVNSKIITDNEFAIINPWRQYCFDRKYIGIDTDGIGYGNISFRSRENNEFIISASATGGISNLLASDYSRVISFDIKNNVLNCEGEKLASSESLSHAAIYKAKPEIKAVLHIHNIDLWKKQLNILPTTAMNAEYGTQAMADAITDIVKKSNDSGIIIMGGHREGILSYGSNLESCIIAINNFFL